MFKPLIALGAVIACSTGVSATPSLISTQDSISFGVPPLLAHVVKAAGIPVINGADYPERCGDKALGIYNTHFNVMVMCTQNIPSAALYVETFAHEAVHLAQDCRVGLSNDALYAGDEDYTSDLYQALPEYKQQNLRDNYSEDNFDYEVEAFYFESNPSEVASALAAVCF